jgi:hypothetical protein
MQVFDRNRKVIYEFYADKESTSPLTEFGLFKKSNFTIEDAIFISMSFCFTGLVRGLYEYS